MDADLAAQFRRTPPAVVRHVDDIWIGAHSQDEAEHVLYTYRTSLREYELDINELKTFISPANKYLPHFWPKELGDLLRSEFALPAGRFRSRSNERAFVLDRVFDLANQ